MVAFEHLIRDLESALSCLVMGPEKEGQTGSWAYTLSDLGSHSVLYLQRALSPGGLTSPSAPASPKAPRVQGALASPVLQPPGPERLPG